MSDRAALRSRGEPAAREVLILDHGRGFGGTVVVAATLMGHLDATRYRATLVSAADPDFVASRVPENMGVHLWRPPYSYVEAGALRDRLAMVPLARVRRVLNFVLSKACALANLPYIWRLAALMRARRVALVHCNNFDNLEGLFLAWCTGTPCLMHAHGLVSPAGPIGRRLRERLRCRAVAISHVVAHSIHRTLVAEQVEVLHNPVQPPAPTSAAEQEAVRRTFRAQYGVPPEAVLAGIVGRVVEWKGQREFVAACLVAMARVPTLHAVVVGDASDHDSRYANAVRAMAAASPYADRFHFTGFVAAPHTVYGALDLLVHASIEPEPFGLVVTEAMVHGVPVIAATSGAPPEFLTNDDTGLLRDPRDTHALGETIAALALDPDRRRALGERGRAFAVRAFDARAYAARMADLYDVAIADREARRQPIRSA